MTWSLLPAGARRRCRRSPLTSGLESCLHRWLKLAGIEEGTRPGVTAPESAELRELRRRNKLLGQENEVLRRAAAFFAREISPK